MEHTAKLISGSSSVESNPPLRGRGLRFVLVNELMGRRSMNVREMAAVLEGYGYELGGRASKVISDALRWELRRGRVVRIGRGLYRYQTAPASTARRIRLFARHCNRWVVALTRIGNSPPTPTDRRSRARTQADGIAPCPWFLLGWLWTM